MDGWHLWKRVWYGVNRKKRGHRHYEVASRTRSAPVSGSFAPQGRYVLGTRHYSFHSHLASGISQRPKVLLDVDCSNLLTGGSEQYENFSPTCWLEDHLHHFGEPVSLSAQASSSSIYWNVEEDQEDDADQEEESGHCPEGTVEDSSPSAEEVEDVPEEEASAMAQDSGAESSVPVERNVDNVSRRRHPRLRRMDAIAEPPPYITEPPPSYEEAIAGNSLLDCGNSDFMW